MKVEHYVCDRCGNEFNKEIGKERSTIVFTDRDVAYDMDPETKDICENCVSNYWDWWDHNSDVDKFIESKQKEWEKEEEK
jgi:hypothetical protein